MVLSSISTRLERLHRWKYLVLGDRPLSIFLHIDIRLNLSWMWQKRKYKTFWASAKLSMVVVSFLDTPSLTSEAASLLFSWCHYQACLDSSEILTWPKFMSKELQVQPLSHSTLFRINAGLQYMSQWSGHWWKVGVNSPSLTPKFTHGWSHYSVIYSTFSTFQLHLNITRFSCG